MSAVLAHPLQKKPAPVEIYEQINCSSEGIGGGYHLQSSRLRKLKSVHSPRRREKFSHPTDNDQLPSPLSLTRRARSWIGTHTPHHHLPLSPSLRIRASSFRVDHGCSPDPEHAECIRKAIIAARRKALRALRKGPLSSRNQRKGIARTFDVVLPKRTSLITVLVCAIAIIGFGALKTEAFHLASMLAIDGLHFFDALREAIVPKELDSTVAVGVSEMVTVGIRSAVLTGLSAAARFGSSGLARSFMIPSSTVPTDGCSPFDSISSISNTILSSATSPMPPLAGSSSCIQSPSASPVLKSLASRILQRPVLIPFASESSILSNSFDGAGDLLNSPAATATVALGVMNDGARATALLQAGHALPFLPFMSFAPAPAVPVVTEDVRTNVASGAYSTVRGAIKVAAAMAGIPNALVIPTFSLLAISASLGLSFVVGQCEKCEKRHRQLHPLKIDCKEDDDECLLAAEEDEEECECLPCRIHDFIVGIKWMKPSEIWGDVSKSLLLYFLSANANTFFGGGSSGAGGASVDGVELLHVFGIGIIATAVAKHVESLLEHGYQPSGSQQGAKGGLNAALLLEGGLLCSTFQVVLKGLHELVPESLNVKFSFNQVLEHMEGTILASIADA